MSKHSLDAKSTPTDKVKNIISLICAIIACTLLIVYEIVFMSLGAENVKNAVDFFTYIFFIDIVFIAVALFLAISEVIRNPFPSSIVSIILSGIALICLFIFLIGAINNYNFTLFIKL